MSQSVATCGWPIVIEFWSRKNAKNRCKRLAWGPDKPWNVRFTQWLPSGKRLHNYGKWPPFSMGKSTISMAIFNSKLLSYQRVFTNNIPLNHHLSLCLIHPQFVCLPKGNHSQFCHGWAKKNHPQMGQTRNLGPGVSWLNLQNIQLHVHEYVHIIINI